MVVPSALLEVISVTPAMRPSVRSSGAATVAAMVSGLAPGMAACTMIEGKSICGSGATGNMRNDSTPATAIPVVSKVVATGRATQLLKDNDLVEVDASRGEVRIVEGRTKDWQGNLIKGKAVFAGKVRGKVRRKAREKAKGREKGKVREKAKEKNQKI